MPWIMCWIVLIAAVLHQQWILGHVYRNNKKMEPVILLFITSYLLAICSVSSFTLTCTNKFNVFTTDHKH